MNGEHEWLSADGVDGGSGFNPIERRSKRRKCVITHACVFLLYQINTLFQVRRFGAKARAAGKGEGLRLNPQCSTQEGHTIYDPCAPGSRIGTTEEMLSRAGNFETEIFPYLSGFHFFSDSRIGYCRIS